MKRLVVLFLPIVLWIFPGISLGQIRADLQTLPEEGSQNLQLWYDQVEWLKLHPIDVNQATVADFLRIPGFPENLATYLVAYRKQHGPFRSRSELRSVLNLSAEDWQWFSAFVRVKRRRTAPRATLRLRTGPIAGTDFPVTQRLAWLGPKGISAGFRIDRRGKELPNHAVGFLAVPLWGRIQILVGHYFLHFGQGLVFNLPYSFGKSQNPGHILRLPSSSVRGDLSGLNGFFLQGAAVQTRSDTWRGILFVAQNTWRASFDSLSGTARLFSSQNGTGFRVQEKLAGVRVQVRWNTARWGISGFRNRFSQPVSGLGNSSPLRNLLLWGTDAQIDLSRFTFSGAWAHTPGRHASFLLGAEVRLARLEWVWLVRRFGTDFWNPHAAVFGEAGNPTNENGMYSGFVFRPARHTRLEVFLDQFRFPRSVTGFPNRAGWEWRLRWTQHWNRRARTVVTLAYKEKDEKRKVLQNGWDAVSILSPLERWRGQFFWWFFPKAGVQVKGHLQFVRAAWQKGSGFPNEKQKGVLLGQEIRWRTRPFLMLTLGWTLFQTGRYASRLYTYEPGLPGSFPIFLAYGTGSRFYFLPQISLGRWGKIGFKTTFFNRIAKPGVNYRIAPPESPRRSFVVQADFRL